MIAWPCQQGHTFHPLCLRNHPGIRNALNHLSVAGDFEEFPRAKCPVCRGIWGESDAADLQRDTLLSCISMDDMPTFGCECGTCNANGDNADPAHYADGMPDHEAASRDPGYCVVCPVHLHTTCGEMTWDPSHNGGDTWTCRSHKKGPGVRPGEDVERWQGVAGECGFTLDAQSFPPPSLPRSQKAL